LLPTTVLLWQVGQKEGCVLSGVPVAKAFAFSDYLSFSIAKSKDLADFANTPQANGFGT
jgi:hypothetical protein